MAKKTAPTTKVVKIPASKLSVVENMLGYRMAQKQDPRINVTLTVDEAVVASKAIGRKLIAQPFVFVRVPVKDVDKIKKAVKK